MTRNLKSGGGTNSGHGLAAERRELCTHISVGTPGVSVNVSEEAAGVGVEAGMLKVLKGRFAAMLSLGVVLDLEYHTCTVLSKSIQ